MPLSSASAPATIRVTIFWLRGTPEDIRQPHSLQLQSLSELGLAGFALVLVLLGGLLCARVSAAAAVRKERLNGAVAVAALGLIVSWAVHTSVDWLHLPPALPASCSARSP